MALEPRSADLTWTGRDGILILDAESGCVLDANPFLTALLGVSREMLRGRRIGELDVFGDRGQIEALFEKARREGYANCDDLPLRTRDRERVVAAVVGNSYLVDSTLVVQFNVSERI